MAAGRPRTKPFADSRLSVQFDRIDLAERGCAALAAEARCAGADAVQIERCDFYLDGDARKRALETLAREIRFFEEEGFPVALWITSLGYGRMTDPDFLRRFPDYQPLVAPDGSTAAVCSTYEPWRDAVAENVRDFIRAGARTILFDDDLVQACRPGVVCVCDEHLRRIAARLGVASVTPEQVRDAYAGPPNPLRSACLDAMGESLMDFCRAMRAAADEVDPSVMLGSCCGSARSRSPAFCLPQTARRRDTTATAARRSPPSGRPPRRCRRSGRGGASSSTATASASSANAASTLGRRRPGPPGASAHGRSGAAPMAAHSPSATRAGRNSTAARRRPTPCRSGTSGASSPGRKSPYGLGHDANDKRRRIMRKTGMGMVGLVFAAFAAVAAGTSTPTGFTDDLDAAMKRAQANGHHFAPDIEKFVKPIEEARAMEVPAHLKKRKAERIGKAEDALTQFTAARDAYRAKKEKAELDGKETEDGEDEGEDGEERPFGSSPDSWLKDWSENVRTNMAIETCASFRETKLRPFLMAQMDPEGKATPDERKVLDASIDYIWGSYGFKSFGDRKRLVEILDRTAKPSFAAFVKACAEKTPAADQLVAWLEDGRFGGEDVRCVFWTLRKNFGFGSKETLARLEKAGVDEWLLLLWRMKIERNAAWAARGGGYANTVTEEGWSGFEDHGDACRAAFRRAWELHPYPEAAYFLSDLGPFEDVVFLDATAAQLDFDEFFGDFLWYNCYPRWCGSLEKMKTFAERCYETGRHDTMVPVVYAEAMLRMIDDAGENQDAYLRGHPEELDRILEVSLPQIANTNAFGKIRQEAGAFATLAYSVKGDWEKAGETFRLFGHGTFPKEMWRVIQDFSRWWTIWDGISGSNRKELQRLHALFTAGDFAGFLKGTEDLRTGVKLDGKEDTYVRWMGLTARMKTDFPPARPVTVAFPKDKLAWLTYGGAWNMNGEYAFYGGKQRRGGDSLEWDVPVPGEFRIEMEIGPHGDRDEWSFDFCQKPADQALAKPGDYPFLMLRFAKGGATASFGEWDEVKDGGDGEPITFPYAGGNVRLVVVYRDGRASVFVGGAAVPLIETDDYARILRRVGEGKFKFNGSGVRLLSMKAMAPGEQSGAEFSNRAGR